MQSRTCLGDATTTTQMVGLPPAAAPPCGTKKMSNMLVSSEDRAIIIKTSLIPIKSTKTSIGVQLMTVKKNHKLTAALSDFENVYESTKGYRKLKLPATGVLLSEKDISKQQISIEDL